MLNKQGQLPSSSHEAMHLLTMFGMDQLLPQGCIGSFRTLHYLSQARMARFQSLQHEGTVMIIACVF